MLPMLFAGLLLAVGPAVPAPAQPLTLTATAFGAPVLIEVRDLPGEGAEAALRAALAEIEAIERLTSPAGDEAGGLAALNGAAAGAGGARAADPRLVELLARAAQFCLWSQGAHGPLGGRLYRLLRQRESAAAPADGEELAAAVASGDCSRLRVDPQAGTAEVAAGSQLDLDGFAAGFAVDRAVGVLRERGAGDGRVRVGGVQRGFGPGPDGGGWATPLPESPGLTRPLTPVWLHDQALAAVVLGPRPPAGAGESVARYFDQRSGRPASGAVATVAVTELALDAQALAVTMFITGSREGSIRLGTLRPTPAVLWLLGGGSGPPILTDFHWSQLKLKQLERRNSREAP